MGPLEDHLLICPGCRDRLEATDEYVAAMKSSRLIGDRRYFGIRSRQTKRKFR